MADVPESATAPAAPAATIPESNAEANPTVVAAADTNESSAAAANGSSEVKAENEPATTTTAAIPNATAPSEIVKEEPKQEEESNDVATKAEAAETTEAIETTEAAEAAEEPTAAKEEETAAAEPAVEEPAFVIPPEEPTGRRPRRSAAAGAMDKMQKAMATEKPQPNKAKPKTSPKASESADAIKAKQELNQAIDALNIGRLVERFDHLPKNGQYYPHHGKIVEQLPQEGRIPDRWVVQWEDPSGSSQTSSNDNNNENNEENAIVVRRDEWTRYDLQQHDTSVETGQNPFRLYNGRRPEKTKLGQPLKATLERIRERYHTLVIRDMEHDSFGKSTTKGKASQNDIVRSSEDSENQEESSGDLLPTLILMAALEDALQTSLQYQQAKELEQQQAEGNETNNTKTKKNNTLDTHPPMYYTANPNHYLVAPSREADAQEDLLALTAQRNPKATVTPAVLAQRIRDGCHWAWTYLQQQANDEQAALLPAPPYSAVSATSIELQTKKAQQALLEPPETTNLENGEGEMNGDGTAPAASAANAFVEQRRSGRSGIGERNDLYDPESGGRRSTRRGGANVNYNESYSNYIPEPNPVQKGGRIALWWLKTLEEERKQQQEREKSASSDVDEVEETKSSSKPNEENEDDVEMKDAAKEALKKSEAAAASNIITGDSYDDAMGGKTDEEDDAGKATTDDEDFEMSKDGDDESDDQLEDVEKERSLTPVPDLEESDEDEEDSDEEEEEIDEEHAIVWDNPYLNPSVPAILEYLSKPKSISGEDVQKAMDDVILRTRHNRRTTTYGLPLQTLEKYDKAILHWENPDHPENGSLVLQCVSGETVNELQRLDSQTFGRAKFELDVIGAQEATIQIRKREDFEQRSEEYKIRRLIDRYRFKGIHEGYAVWPSWQDEAKRWISQNVTTVMETATDATAGANDTKADAATPQDDEALARKLAEEAAAAAEAEAATSRRSGRRTRGGGAGAEGGVFYGNQSNMTQRQLMDALIRLAKAREGGSTLAILQELVADDSSDPLRRIRIALGKILWKRNLLTKLPVSSENSDRALLEQLNSGKPLLQLQQEEDAQALQQTHDEVETSDLLQYLTNLHRTELRLRNLVLKQLGTIPLPVIATAADERLGTLENMDTPDFEDQSTIEWRSSGSDLIGTLIYRPSITSTLGEENTLCYFYKIQDWSGSIPSEADDAEEDAVERRKRFRAIPQDYSGEALLLTEAQVHAGKKAAELKAKQEQVHEQNSWTSNPYASEIGDRITLVANDDNGVNLISGAKELPSEISGRVVGHDTVQDVSDGDSNYVEYRILILPEDTSESLSGLASPFWSILNIRADDSSYLCQPMGQTKWYSIENQDFHADSEPFKACQGVLDWLSRQSKAMAFMEPVDPVALGIPTYPDVVKHPMDISTMNGKLESGAYSIIPQHQSVGSSTVCRMLNGPFKRDLNLIFDNAMLFNPPGDWIHAAASTLKKSCAKKIENLSYAAEKKHSGSGGRKSIYADEDSDVDMYEYESDHDEEFVMSSRRGGSKRKRSAQVRTSSNKDEAAARPMEHPIKLQNVLKDGNDLRGRFSGLPLNGYASTYSMPPNWSCKAASNIGTETADKDSESEDEEVTEDIPSADQEHMQEMAELLSLQKQFGAAETSSLRRSARETRPTSRRSNRDRKKDAAKKTEGLEYYLVDGSKNSSNNPDASDEAHKSQTLSSIPKNRLDVEILLEKRHEDHYSKLYQKHESILVSKDNDNRYAMYSSGSFPPYLGRVIPSQNSYGFTWEIRPPFAVPALRWILRGLVFSGHLSAVEPLFGGSVGGSSDLASGVILANDVYYWNPETCTPFEVLDTRELQRKKRAGKSDDDSSEDEVEMSEYEKLRAERVARNAERLKALGLA